MNSPARAVAQEVAALINRQPHSPSIDQLEAIIAGVVTRQDTSTLAMTPAPAVLEWHGRLAEEDRKWTDGRLSEAEWTALHDGQVSFAKQAFAKPVRSWEDVALLGAIAMYWNFQHDNEDDQQEMRMLLAKTDHTGMDQQSLAHLLKAICTMGGFAPGEIPTEAKDDPTLRDLQQMLEAAGQLHATAQDDDATRIADAADREIGTLSERIFDARPVTLYNLKQRAVIARYWHQFGDDGAKWMAPEDCGEWEDEVIAQLIHGVLQIDTPPDRPSVEMVALPSPELALFRSALEGIAEFRRISPEPRPSTPGYESWTAEHDQRLQGLCSIAERILSSKAPPLDALAAIAAEFVLLGGYPEPEGITDKEAHDRGLGDQALGARPQPSIQPKAGE